MSSNPFDVLTNIFSNVKVCGDGISFVGKSLKLNNAEDAKVVTDAINACKNLEYLNLEGNTLGVEAAKAIGVALGAHPELKRALWKDMFTGRMKNEIPQALRFLGSGLEMANVRLVELDLSDNAFGPIGMEGLASLLRSPSCYSLQELRLNNNGLGITGAKLLAKALMDCYEKSKSVGNPLPLRVFIAGRNRLENEGITALSKVFNVLGSLEEIQIPQNGIYHRGIKELSEALKQNRGLRILNLNDNTLTHKGSMALASALPNLQLLRHINLGDCLLKTTGALSIAGGLQLKHLSIEELILDNNEIKKDGGLAIAQAMENKRNLKLLLLDGNQFGKDGVKLITEEMARNNMKNALGTFENNESEDEDDEENDDEEEEEEEDPENGDELNGETDVDDKDTSAIVTALLNVGNDLPPVKSTLSTENTPHVTCMDFLKNITAADFLQFPSPERFLAFKGNKAEEIMAEIKEGSPKKFLQRILTAIMKVSSLANVNGLLPQVLECSSSLYQELFKWGQTHDELSKINNMLMIHLKLIKSEDKSWNPDYNHIACLSVVRHAVQQNYFPQASRDVLNCLLQKSQSSTETINIS